MRSHGIHHIELFTGDRPSMNAYLRDRMGFSESGGPPRTDTDRVSTLLHQNAIRLVVSEPRAEGAVAQYVRRHGDGVADVALSVPDAREAFQVAVRRGADPVAPPAVRRRPGATPVLTAAVSGPGDLVHSLVQEPVARMDARTTSPLLEIDHVALCLPAGELGEVTRFYQDVFGFSTIFEEKIVVSDQGMDSKVMRNDAGDITFTLIEPDATRSPGQIDKFLAGHGGAGVQHIAFSTTGIADAVRILRDRGLEFLTAPEQYYAMLSERLPELEREIRELRELNVLADRDHWGHLLQIFTKSVHPANTLFYELIERRNAKTFGSGNIRALYEAVQQELLSTLTPERP